MSMAMDGYREIRQTSVIGKFFRFLFFAFNILMTIWLVQAWVTLSQMDNLSGGAAIGGAIGTLMILVIWGMGAGILGLLMLATRGERVLVPNHSVPQPRWRWGVAIVIVALCAWAGWQLSWKPSGASANTQARDNPESVQISQFSWRKDGFGNVMTATFRLRNTNSFAVKDVVVRCVHSAPSGTKVDSNTRTIYEIIKPKAEFLARDVNMGFIVSDASRSNCSTVRFTPLS
jgi:hypothetical protein